MFNVPVINTVDYCLPIKTAMFALPCRNSGGIFVNMLRNGLTFDEDVVSNRRISLVVEISPDFQFGTKVVCDFEIIPASTIKFVNSDREVFMIYSRRFRRPSVSHSTVPLAPAQQ